jgi:hypothetical protein
LVLCLFITRTHWGHLLDERCLDARPLAFEEA